MNEPTWREWATHLSTGVALVDASLRLRWINPALAELLPSGARRLPDQPLAWLLPESDVLQQAHRALTEQRAIRLRGVMLDSDTDAPMRADVALQPLADGQLLLEVHVLAEPATDASPLSATLRGFAHEVRNPLAGLRGAAQLLQRRLTDADQHALAGRVIDEADRLTALANRLLHHDGAPQLAPVNIHAVLEHVDALLQAEPAPLIIRHDYDPSLPDVIADAGRLQQIVLNLARNAREAGAAALTWRTRAEYGVRLGERVLRSALRLEVVDDGPGVPHSLRDTLFQPLVSGRSDGTGLGLALSREIAHEHGGDLRHHNRPGQTVFTLYLPLPAAVALDLSSTRTEHAHDA